MYQTPHDPRLGSFIIQYGYRGKTNLTLTYAVLAVVAVVMGVLIITSTTRQPDAASAAWSVCFYAFVPVAILGGTVYTWRIINRPVDPSAFLAHSAELYERGLALNGEGGRVLLGWPSFAIVRFKVWRSR